MQSNEVGPDGGDEVLFVVQIGLPRAFADVLPTTQIDARLTVFGVSFADWSTVVCAIWALLVVCHGPFTIPRPAMEKSSGGTRCR